MQSEDVVIHLLQEKSGEQPLTSPAHNIHNNGGLILQDGSNYSNQSSVLASNRSNGSDTSHVLFSRLSVDTTNLRLLTKSKSLAQQVIGTGTGNNGLAGINAKGSGGEVNHLEDLYLTNLLSSGNKYQFVKGTAEIKNSMNLKSITDPHSLMPIAMQYVLIKKVVAVLILQKTLVRFMLLCKRCVMMCAFIYVVCVGISLFPFMYLIMLYQVLIIIIKTIMRNGIKKA